MIRPQPIFQRVEGFLLPRLPHNPDGTLREPDGQDWLGVDQVAAAKCTDARTVIRVFASFLEDLFPANNQDAIVADAQPRDARPGDPDSSQRILHEIKYSDLSEDEFQWLLEECRQRGLSPWGRQIYHRKNWNARDRRHDIQILLTIDGFRGVAADTREYAGTIGPEWCGADGLWKDVWLADGAPLAARIGVRRKGVDEPTFRVAKWEEYAQFNDGPNGPTLAEFWERMPAHMLAKVAEALAFRAAFPERLGGLYSIEEMMQASNPRLGPRPGRSTAARPTATVWDGRYLSAQGVRLGLIEIFNIGDPQKREQIVNHFARKWQLLLDQNPSGFYSAVLTEVSQNPQNYGAPAA